MGCAAARQRTTAMRGIAVGYWGASLRCTVLRCGWDAHAACLEVRWGVSLWAALRWATLRWAAPCCASLREQAGWSPGSRWGQCVRNETSPAVTRPCARTAPTALPPQRVKTERPSPSPLTKEYPNQEGGPGCPTHQWSNTQVSDICPAPPCSVPPPPLPWGQPGEGGGWEACTICSVGVPLCFGAHGLSGAAVLRLAGLCAPAWWRFAALFAVCR